MQATPNQIPGQNVVNNGEVFVERTLIQQTGSVPLQGAHLQGAHLQGTHIQGAPLQGMTLISTEVGQPVITHGGANLVGVNQQLVGNQTGLPGQFVGGQVLQQGTLNNQGMINTPNTLQQGTLAGAGNYPTFNNGQPVNVQNIGTGTAGTNYSGTYSFRLMEGRFFKDHDTFTPMDPYVKIKIGPHIGRSVVAKKQGVTPVWNDVVTLERKHFGNFAKIKVKDRDRLSLNDRIGETRIPLSEIAVKGSVAQWFPVFKKNEKTGDLLMEVTFQPVI